MPVSAAYCGVRALVLGASGFIGRWMVRALHASGATVTVAARDSDRAAAALGDLRTDVRVVITDLAQPGSAIRLVEDTAPAITFNLAGYGVRSWERDPRLMVRLNTEVVQELCLGLRARADERWAGAQLVHAGSALEYGPLEGTIREDREPQPTTDYGRTKLEGARAVAACCAASKLRAVVARLFTVYGPGDYPDKLLPALMRAARTGARLQLTSGRQRRNFIYVADVVDGLLRLGTSAATPGEIVNLATDRLTSVREFAETGAAVLRIDPAHLEFGALADRADEMWHGKVDVSRLFELTTWLPRTTTADGIRRSWELDDAG
jgi:nucleoside-diphosphate-sugar epimerase